MDRDSDVRDTDRGWFSLSAFLYASDDISDYRRLKTIENIDQCFPNMLEKGLEKSVRRNKFVKCKQAAD